MNNPDESGDKNELLSIILNNIISNPGPHDIPSWRRIDVLRNAFSALEMLASRLKATEPDGLSEKDRAACFEGIRGGSSLPQSIDGSELRYISASGTGNSTIGVAIDALNISPGVSGGVEVYMKTLVRALLTTIHYSPIIICLPQHLEHYRSIFKDAVGYCTPHVRRIDRDYYALWTKSLKSDELFSRPYLEVQPHSFRYLAHACGARILHSPIQIFSFLDSGLPSVLNLHDLQHIHLPENFTEGDIIARNRLYGQSATQATVIVASSKFVADDIARHMPFSSGKIDMIPVTWNPDLKVDMDEGEVQKIRSSYNLPENFFFFPGQFWKHKNHVNLIKAFALTRKKNPDLDLHLVLTGYRGHSGWPAAAQAIAEEDIDSKVRCLDYIPIEDLPAIYKSAIACVMPSLFEASSYPVIEAQRMRCPSACSAVTSLPELMAGGAGLLFDPYNIEDISGAMHALCVDVDLRLSIVDRAYNRVMAENSMEAYSRALSRLYRKVLCID